MYVCVYIYIYIYCLIADLFLMYRERKRKAERVGMRERASDVDMCRYKVSITRKNTAKLRSVIAHAKGKRQVEEQVNHVQLQCNYALSEALYISRLASSSSFSRGGGGGGPWLCPCFAKQKLEFSEGCMVGM